MKRRRWAMRTAFVVAALVTGASLAVPPSAADVTPSIGVASLSATGGQSSEGVFSAGTRTLTYSFTFSHVWAGHTLYRVELRGPNGVFLRSSIHRAHHESVRASGTFSLVPAFFPGHYALRLIIDGHQALARSVRIQDGLVIARVRVTTDRALATLRRKGKLPSSVKNFPSGTRTLDYYFDYLGARPGATTVQARLYSGAVALTETTTVYHLAFANGYIGSAYQSFLPFPDDTYQLVVTDNGRVVGSTQFTVGAKVSQHTRKK